MALVEFTHRFKTLGGQGRVRLVLPEQGAPGEAPVVLLLHGASDDGSGWLRFTAAERYAAEKNVVLVAPDARNSYYADMACGPQFFRFVTGELPAECARLFGLSSYEAAKKLAYDFGMDPDKPPAAMALKKPYPLARAFRNDEIHCQRVLCDYLHLLERWKVEYAPQSPEDELDDRFVEACHMIEYVNDLLDVLMFAELKQRVKAVDMLLKDGTITALEQRLRRLEKEVQHRGEERAIA